MRTREDAELRGVVWIVRRQHEGRFRAVELNRDLIYLRVGHTARVQNCGERIAAKTEIRENIDGDIFESPHIDDRSGGLPSRKLPTVS